MGKKVFVFLIFILTLFLSLTSSAKEDELKKINQLQLQEENQRFYGRLYSRISESVSHDQKFNPKTDMLLLQQLLTYNIEALKIVTSPYPVINYLDMLVFIKLCKFAIRDYWIPKVFGKKEMPLLRAFQESERDLENIARKFMKSPNLYKVDRLVSDWRKTHKGEYRVERVRLSDFTSFVEVARIEKDSHFSLSNMIVDTESAVERVDEALLAANRAMFLVQNIPGVIRYQMRVGVQEVIDDSLSNLTHTTKLTKELEKTRPLVEDLTSLVRSSDVAIKNMKALVKELPKDPTLSSDDVTKNLSQLDSIVTKSNDLLSTLLVESQGKKEKFQKMKDEVYKMIFTFFGIFILSALVIIAGWWIGKYVYETKLHKRS